MLLVHRINDRVETETGPLSAIQASQDRLLTGLVPLVAAHLEATSLRPQKLAMSSPTQSLRLQLASVQLPPSLFPASLWCPEGEQLQEIGEP